MRRRVGERVATPKHEGGSVMELETFVSRKVGDLHQLKGKLYHTGHHSILQHHAISSEMRLVSQGFVLMQDNDPKHTSKLCQRYIRSKEE